MQKFHWHFQFQTGMENNTEDEKFEIGLLFCDEINTQSSQLLYVLTTCSNGWGKKTQYAHGK